MTFPALGASMQRREKQVQAIKRICRWSWGDQREQQADMKPWCGVLRGLTIACVVLGGAVLSSGAIGVVTAESAFAQGVSSIVVEGNRRVEADTIRSYFHGLNPAAIDEGLKALYATGLFEDVKISQPGG